MAMTTEHADYWSAFCDRTGADHAGCVVVGFAGDADITDHLIDLYLRGAKTAGSGLVADYRASGDPLPEVGDHWIVLDSSGEPRCILRTVRVETHAFAEVPARIAEAEGEGDRSLAYWRECHAAVFAPHLQAWGVGDLDHAMVVTEFFEVVQR